MAKVKSVESSPELLSLIEKSGLLTAEQLESARAICNGESDPKTAARELLKAGLLTNWQAGQLVAGATALTVGPYQLLDQIGKGELGRVFLARRPGSDQKVAVKALASKHASDPKLVERFIAEAKAAGAFEHRNVLRVLEVAQEEERPHVVTEFVAGGDLQQRVDKAGPLPPAIAAELVAQAADGMAYVHGQGVLHRNLKPANLLVDDQGTVKILDVGIGQLRQAEKSGNESTGELLLSALGYMSPEQIRNKELDARSDIYALGGVLYFLLTARVPFTANSNEERDLIRQSKRPVPVTTLKPDIPAELAAFCDQMMALKATDRPASMDDVAARLRELVGAPAKAAQAAAAEGAAAVEELSVEHAATEELAAADEATVDAATAEGSPLGGLDELEMFSEEPAAAATAADVTTESAPEKTSAPLAASAKSATAKSATGDESAGSGDAVKIVIDGVGTAQPKVVESAVKIQKKKKKEIVESIAATGEGEADSALAAVAKKKKRQRLILLGTAGVSLLVIVLGMAVMMLSSDEPVQVADQGGAQESGQGAAAAAADPAAATPAANAALDPNDPENMPDPESIPDPVAAPAAGAVPGAAAVPAGAVASGAPATGAPVAPAAGAVPGVVPPGVVPPAAGAMPPAATPAVAAAPTPDPTAASTGAPVPTATDVAAAAPAPAATPAPAPPATTTPAPATATATPATEPPAAGTPPATPPATTPPPASPAETKKEEPKPDPMPEPAKPAPPKPATPPKKKAAKTFEIATAVELPPLPTEEGGSLPEGPSKVLGKINIEAKDTCFIAMSGGDKAIRGRVQFALRNAQGGTAPRDWEFVEQEAAGTETVIATLTLPADELKFEWTPEGLKSPNAGAIRNCALKITAGQEKPHMVALRTTMLAPPLAVENLDRSLNVRFPIDAVPDGSAMRMEPTIPNMKFVYDSGGPDLTKGDQWIYLGETKEQAPLGLKLDTNVTPRGIQISLDSYLIVPNEKPQKLTPALRKKLSIANLQREAATLAARLDEMKKRKKEEQAKMQNEMNLTSLARENLDKAIQHLQKLDEVTQQLTANGKIHFRIYYDTGEHQVELVKTADDAPPLPK